MFGWEIAMFINGFFYVLFLAGGGGRGFLELFEERA